MSRYKNILFLVSVLVLQIIGLAVQIRRPSPNAADSSSVRLIRFWAISLVSPPEKAIHGTGKGFRGFWSNYLDLRNVREQNQDLREQLNRLQLEQASLLEDARQGQRLQAMLAFKEKYISSTVAAQVIGTAGTDQSRILYIDKGSKDGLKPDMPVITPDGIVGKLKDVFGHTSQVLVISDQTSGAGVLLEQTRLRGVLRGNALGQPQIINMLPDERVKPGEKVITSGGDQIFPRGLPVGVVDRVVEDSSNPPYVDIIIKPAANLGHLEELLVITQSSEEMPQQEKIDLAQSAAAGVGAVTLKRASDILSERLPGIDDPIALADTPSLASTLPTAAPVNSNLHPPPALHSDHFTPDAIPPASAMTPGQAVTDQKYAPQPKSEADSVSTATRPATVAKKPATAGTASAPAKPKAPKPPPSTDQPAIPGVTAPASEGAPPQ